MPALYRGVVISAVKTHAWDPDLAEQQQNRWRCLAVSRSPQQWLVARIQRQLLILRKGLLLGRAGLTQKELLPSLGGPTEDFIWGRS